MAAAILTGCSARPRPSIVFVLVDTLRADHLGAYGFPAQISPRLDRIAAESVVFTRCFSPARRTKPVVASLFTSLHPETHGLTNQEGRYWGDGSADGTLGVLPKEALTLAEALRAAGVIAQARHLRHTAISITSASDLACRSSSTGSRYKVIAS